MERVTEKRVIYPVCRKGETPEKREFIYIKNKVYAEKKLFALENIEQEFGVSLVKLLNAKKVYYMTWNNDCTGFVIAETHRLFINLTNRTIEFFEHEYSEFTFDLELKNYGKNDVYCGWAFTKEELENGKETS